MRNSLSCATEGLDWAWRIPSWRGSSSTATGWRYSGAAGMWHPGAWSRDGLRWLLDFKNSNVFSGLDDALIIELCCSAKYCHCVSQKLRFWRDRRMVIKCLGDGGLRRGTWMVKAVSMSSCPSLVIVLAKLMSSWHVTPHHFLIKHNLSHHLFLP